jgi:hypothetical protein
MMRMSRRTRACRVAAAFLAAVAAPAGLAQAAPVSEPIVLTLDFFVSGLNVYRLRWRAELGAESYQTTASMESVGLASLFSSLEMDMTARGRIQARTLQPEAFSSVQSKKGTTKRIEVAWPGGAKPQATHSHALKADRASAVEQLLRPGMPDPVTALLGFALRGTERPCAQSQRIYNGREIFELQFGLVREDQLGAEAPGVYRGKAFQCRLLYKPVAGYAADEMAKQLRAPATFRIWYAPIASTAAGREILLPVAASGQYKGHEFLVHASTATIGGRPLNAQSLATR